MKLPIIVFTIFACFIERNVADWKKNIDSWCGLRYCQFYETAVEEYRDFFELKEVKGCQPPGYLTKFEFYAAGPKNYHVIFSPKLFPEAAKDKVYEIVIGYPSNSKTWTAIRVYTASDDLKKEETPHILKPNAPNHVIISITEDGVIAVSVNNVTAAIARDSHPLAIKYFSFRSWESSNVQYFYDCKRESSNIIANE